MWFANVGFADDLILYEYDSTGLFGVWDAPPEQEVLAVQLLEVGAHAMTTTGLWAWGCSE